MFRILRKEMLDGITARLDIEVPRIAKVARPGQFLMVHDGEKGERIPLNISDCDPVAGSVTIVVRIYGASTRKLVDRFRVDEVLADVVGPLGHHSALVDLAPEEIAGKRWLFVSGGVAASALYPQVKWVCSHGGHADAIVRDSSADLLLYLKELGALCDHVDTCTEDGSAGYHGSAAGKLAEVLASSGREYAGCVAIGPTEMMRDCSRVCKEAGVPVTVSMNSIMVDGAGMCGSCRVTVDGKMKFACVDGPEFDGTLVDWDEAIRRSLHYRPQEAAAMENYGK